jgi:hypothetical protein
MVAAGAVLVSFADTRLIRYGSMNHLSLVRYSEIHRNGAATLASDCAIGI